MIIPSPNGTGQVQAFTAAQIARALGRKRQAMQRALQSVTPTGQVIVGGNKADAWLPVALPDSMRSELKSLAEKGGYRDEVHLLNSSGPRWESPLSLSEVAPHCVDKAAKLQHALRRVLQLQNNLAVSAPELERIGLEDYQREFDHAITGRYLRALVKRTRDRAGNAGEFNRLEIYLDESPARKNQPKPMIAGTVQDEFRELLDVIQTFKNPAAPTDTERDYLWLRAFELLEEKTGAGAHLKKTRLDLRKFLVRNAPFLAKNANALRVAFKHKFDRWCQAERKADALRDGRKGNSGNHRAPELKPEDRDKMIAHAVLNCGGRLSQAWAELAERNALSEDLLSYYTSTPASKSYVPAKIREAVKHEVAMLADNHLGPRTARLNGAHLFRDWSNVASMDWLCADDATLEVYFYVPDGQGWFTLTRGQLLLMIDVRTTRILGYAMLPEKHYNARAIRTLITKVADEHGLPRRGFYFERGIWQKSSLLKGDPNAVPFSWGEAEVGLRGLGLRFVHSRLPRSKPVERVLGAFQDMMDGEPGFVGGNEMKVKFERVQKHKLLVESRKEQPSKFFYNLDQWIEHLDEFCARYNSARQDGTMLTGLSPDEAFDKFARLDDPLIGFPPSCRFLLSHHMRPVSVTRNGITLRFGKQVYNYRSEQTGHLIGQRLLAFFNPETPEILTVTDLKRENPFCVARSQTVPAMDAPAELLEQEMARADSHNAYARTRYRILKARYSVPFRATVADMETVSLGREIAAQQTALTARREQEAKHQTKTRTAARNLNITLSPTAARRPETAPALERLNELLNDEESK
jgi:hypothetical protein